MVESVFQLFSSNRTLCSGGAYISRISYWAVVLIWIFTGKTVGNSLEMDAFVTNSLSLSASSMAFPEDCTIENEESLALVTAATAAS